MFLFLHSVVVTVTSIAQSRPTKQVKICIPFKIYVFNLINRKMFLFKTNDDQYYCSEALTCKRYQRSPDGNYVQKSINHVMCNNANVSFRVKMLIPRQTHVISFRRNSVRRVQMRNLFRLPIKSSNLSWISTTKNEV